MNSTVIVSRIMTYFPWRKVMNLSIQVEFLQAIGPTVWYSGIDRLWCVDIEAEI